MGSAFHQLCPRYSGTLTPTAPTAIWLWDTFTFFSVRIWVSLNPDEFRLFPTFSVSLVLREPFEIEFGTILLVDWIT